MIRKYLAALVLALTALSPAAFGDDAAPASSRPVDLAICLDTSGSMNGLIDSAKQRIWTIVNDLALAKPTPRLRVALLTFGNDGHSPESGWVMIDVPFTDDLDLVSQKLFALTTNGGTELVGRVVDAATRQLDWTKAPGTLKVLVVAGNESADQDNEVPFRDACRRAIGADVVINAIYCGNPADEIAPAWREVASLADGQFAAIDQAAGTVAILSPFDAELSALGAKLNETYVPMGTAGAEGQMNQIEQDKNAVSANSAVAAGRAQSKATELYRCSWDMVDACRDGQVKIEDVKEADLPPALKKMTLEERKKQIALLQAKRTAVQKSIALLAAKRDAFVAGELKKVSEDAGRAFDDVVRQAIRTQAEAKGFTFPATAEVG
jgi:hypothetical protein